MKWKHCIHQNKKLNVFWTQWVNKPDVIGAVCKCLEEIAAQEQLKCMSAEVFQKYTHVFEPIPHVDDLPTDIYCRIKIKDSTKTISIWTYSSPQKYQEALQTLIWSHEDASQIRPSNSEHASPSFLTPKADPKVLPCWVNDYQVLNSNTVLDSYPLLCVDDILADCAKGKIWSHLCRYD